MSFKAAVRQLAVVVAILLAATAPGNTSPLLGQPAATAEIEHRQPPPLSSWQGEKRALLDERNINLNQIANEFLPLHRVTEHDIPPPLRRRNIRRAALEQGSNGNENTGSSGNGGSNNNGNDGNGNKNFGPGNGNAQPGFGSGGSGSDHPNPGSFPFRPSSSPTGTSSPPNPSPFGPGVFGSPGGGFPGPGPGGNGKGTGGFPGGFPGGGFPGPGPGPGGNGNSNGGGGFGQGGNGGFSPGGSPGGSPFGPNRPPWELPTTGLSNVKDIYYLANITINGHSFLVNVDTGSSDTWVVGRSFFCSSGNGFPLMRQMCGFGQSFRGHLDDVIQDQPFRRHFADGTFASGYFGFADVSLGGLTAHHQQVAVVNFTHWYGDGKSSGLLGLAYPLMTALGTNTNKQYDPVFTTMWKDNLTMPLFTLALSRYESVYSHWPNGKPGGGFGGFPGFPGGFPGAHSSSSSSSSAAPPPLAQATPQAEPPEPPGESPGLAQSDASSGGASSPATPEATGDTSKLLPPVPAPDVNANSSYIAFGGVPPYVQYDDGTWARTPIEPLAKLREWSFIRPNNEHGLYVITPTSWVYSKKVDGVVRTVTNTTQLPVSVDAGSTLTIVPKDLADSVLQSFDPPARWVSSGGAYYAPCNAKVPIFGVQVGVQVFNIEAADMLRQNERDPETGRLCRVGIAGGPAPYVLGVTFLTNVIAVFDVGHGEMRFAKRHNY